MANSPDLDSIAALQSENARLTALLDAHGIQWRQKAQTEPLTPLVRRLD